MSWRKARITSLIINTHCSMYFWDFFSFLYNLVSTHRHIWGPLSVNRIVLLADKAASRRLEDSDPFLRSKSLRLPSWTSNATRQITGTHKNHYKKWIHENKTHTNSMEMTLLRSHQSLSCSRISQHFMEPKVSVPCLQQPSTGPCPEPDKSSLYHPILFLRDSF
jgi:hypothetical protein